MTKEEIKDCIAGIENWGIDNIVSSLHHKINIYATAQTAELQRRVEELEGNVSGLEALHELSTAMIETKDQEIERLKGLAERVYMGTLLATKGIWEDTNVEKEMQQFKTDNNL